MISAHQLVPVMGVTLGLAFGSAATAKNAVSDWHTNMESAVVVTGKKAPNVAFVYFAYADVAMYDAVNSIDGRFQPFAVRVNAPRDACKDAAASVAAHDVLVHYLPLQQATLDADQFLASVPPPPALTSATFTRDFNLTKAYGALNSSVRTAQQTEIGRFWSDNAAAQYSRALRGLIDSQGLDTADAARLGAMFFVAGADSLTACWNAKYHYFFWRPVTAIRNAGTDGNPDTVADPNWMPLDVTPQHPEYPAAHGCVTQAVMDVLTAFFQTDEIPYSVTSTVTGTTHFFDRFEDVVTEVDNARIFGGMHFHHSVKEGNRLGSQVADYILNHKFCRADEQCGGDDQ